jgi:hypothetical protein
VELASCDCEFYVLVAAFFNHELSAISLLVKKDADFPWKRERHSPVAK